MLKQAFFKLPDAGDFQVIEEAFGRGVDRDALVDGVERRELSLLEEFHHACTTVQLLLAGGVEFGTQLSKRLEFAVRREVQTERTGHFLHRLDLGRTTHTGHGDTHVHCGSNTSREEFGLQVDLTVGDRNHVGGDVGRHVTFLGFDDGQRGQRTGTVLVRKLGRPFEQPAVQIEHVTGIGFTTWRTTEQQGELAIRHGLLGQVVINHQRVLGQLAFFALPHEVFGHGTTGIWRDVLHGSRGRRRSRDHDGVVHRTGLLEVFHHRGHGGFFLTHRHVDADHGVIGAPVLLLVDDGVKADRSLSGLPVTNDEFPLAPADWNHGVNRLDTGGHGFGDGLPERNAGSHNVELHLGVGFDGRSAVEGVAQGIHHAAQQAVASGHFEQAGGGFHRVAFLNGQSIAVDHAAHGVEFEVHHLAHHRAFAGVEFHKFTGHGLGQSVYPGDAVAHFHHASDFRDFQFSAELFDLLLEDRGDFVSLDLHSVLSRGREASKDGWFIPKEVRGCTRCARRLEPQLRRLRWWGPQSQLRRTSSCVPEPSLVALRCLIQCRCF